MLAEDWRGHAKPCIASSIQLPGEQNVPNFVVAKQRKDVVKVHIFWEGLIILRNLHVTFDIQLKVRWRFSQNFVAFSEYMNFIWLHSGIGLEPYFHKDTWPLITLCLIIKIYLICFRRKTNWKYHNKDWRTPKAKRPGTGWQTWTAGKGIEGKRKRHHQSRIEFEKCQRFKKTRRKEKATNYQGTYSVSHIITYP